MSKQEKARILQETEEDLQLIRNDRERRLAEAHEENDNEVATFKANLHAEREARKVNLAHDDLLARRSSRHPDLISVRKGPKRRTRTQSHRDRKSTRLNSSHI